MKKQLVTNDGRVVIRLPVGHKIKYIEGMNRTGLNQSEFLIYLLENYEGDRLAVLQNYRSKINSRIKKGINILYINELRKIKDLIDPILQRL